jgi:hypothetical protein
VLTWRCKEKHKFPTIALLAWHIFNIPTSQIETKYIFSIAGILMALQRCCLQIEILDKLIFINKNWPFDF